MTTKQVQEYRRALKRKWLGGFILGMITGGFIAFVITSQVILSNYIF